MTTIVQRFLFTSSATAAAVRALACRQTVVVSQQNQLASHYYHHHQQQQHFVLKNQHYHQWTQSKCFSILSQNIVKNQHQQQLQQPHRTTMSESSNNSSATPASGKPKVIFVLGAPGSGKGTQCANIVSQYGYVHLSAGDLLRAERNRPGSELAQTIEEYIRAGQIIPVAVTCSLIERAMNEQMQADAAKNKFLIDGFPRNQDNLDGWVKQMEAKVNLQFVLFFECPDGVCIDRCLSRGIGRSDDNIESLKKRFNVFYSETMPIVDYYEQKLLVRRVNSEKPPELVFEDVQQAFNDYDAK